MLCQLKLRMQKITLVRCLYIPHHPWCLWWELEDSEVAAHGLGWLIGSSPFPLLFFQRLLPPQPGWLNCLWNSSCLVSQRLHQMCWKQSPREGWHKLLGIAMNIPAASMGAHDSTPSSSSALLRGHGLPADTSPVLELEEDQALADQALSMPSGRAAQGSARDTLLVLWLPASS